MDRTQIRERRTLKDYRPQHDEDCPAIACAQCGYDIFRHMGWKDPLDHAYVPVACTCGLDALLAAEETRETARSSNPPPPMHDIGGVTKRGI